MPAPSTHVDIQSNRRYHINDSHREPQMGGGGCAPVIATTKHE